MLTGECLRRDIFQIAFNKEKNSLNMYPRIRTYPPKKRKHRKGIEYHNDFIAPPFF
jgi:hypothetical protein